MNLPKYLLGMLFGLLLIFGGIGRILYFSNKDNLMMSLIFISFGLAMFGYYLYKNKKSNK